MNELVFRNANGVPMTNSLLVAETFGKQHLHVVRDIENLLEKLQDVENQCNPKLDAHKTIFLEQMSDIAMPNGGTRTSKYYVMNREGFTLLAMGYTGKKALEFKLRYITAFNLMEQQLNQGFQIQSDFMQTQNEFMQTQMQMMNQMMQLCNSMMQRLDHLEARQEPKESDSAQSSMLASGKWRKYVMNVCDIRSYYPRFIKVSQATAILRDKGLPVYNPTLYQYLRDKGYLRSDNRSYNRPSEECERNGWMVSTWSGSHRHKHPGRHNFVPYLNPKFLSVLEEQLRGETKIGDGAIQLTLPLGKEVQP